MQRKSRAAAKKLAANLGIVRSPIDEQKSQLLPTDRKRFEINIYMKND
jgi:hypothetical protein